MPQRPSTGRLDVDDLLGAVRREDQRWARLADADVVLDADTDAVEVLGKARVGGDVDLTGGKRKVH